ncbi:hypothetical protein QWY14_14460 [Planococcus sp. N028]|uniref:Response regulatory domain-containing protein n=1 Tax=Planococcus shixiaomingii TaxID=3058393 RepID=A0ABT8N552_9BACL|nr:hypothetical protein [Planococcus sp. N028]MDN7243015.1 hypothetical protein [Planococcus sp. N028]
MINILIADDNPLKLKNIQERVLNVLNIPIDNITIATDIINAKRALRDKHFDLFIVDIQLPLRFQEDPKINGGLELIKDIKSSVRYKLPTNIIGFSEYEESIVDVAEEFSINLFTLIKYDNSTDEWINQLQNHIRYIIAAKISFFERQKNYDFDLAITCALDQVELKSILNLPGEWEIKNFEADSVTYYTGFFKNEKKTIRVVAASSSQMGMTAAAVLAMKMIEHFRPKYLIMCGITAGVKDNVNLGDIIIADPSWDYGSGKYTVSGDDMEFLPDPSPLRINTDVIGKIKNMCSNDALLQRIKASWPASTPSGSLQAHIGPAASGAAVLSNPQIVEDIIKHNRKLIGVEMETYGVLYAAIHSTKPRPLALSVKSVSDFADEGKNNQFQDYASYTSANFVYYLTLEYLDFD